MASLLFSGLIMANPFYPISTSRLPAYALFKVLNGDPSFSQTGTVAILPLPSGITVSDGASYENKDTGLMGGILGKSATGAGITEDELLAKADQLGAMISEQKGVASQALKSVVARMGGNAGRVATGISPNPNTRAVFRQVNMRTFQYSLKMIPESVDEAENIKEVVKTFRKELYPEPDEKRDGFILNYKFPNLFHIQFIIDAEVTEPQFLPCYLTNMTVAYNSSSNSFMAKDGGSVNYSETDMSLTFMEYRALDKEDIDNDTFPAKGLS